MAKLEELRPLWVSPPPGRHNLAFQVLCPGHLGTHHSVRFVLVPPLDGGPELPMPADEVPTVRVHWAALARDLLYDEPLAGWSWEDLTLWPCGRDDGERIIIPGHWEGWVTEGTFFTPGK